MISQQNTHENSGFAAWEPTGALGSLWASRFPESGQALENIGFLYRISMKIDGLLSGSLQEPWAASGPVKYSGVSITTQSMTFNIYIFKLCVCLQLLITQTNMCFKAWLLF